MGASLTCLYANAHNMGNKHKELEVCAHRATTSSGSKRHGGTHNQHAVMGRYRLKRRTDWEGEDVQLPFTRGSSWNAKRSALGLVRSQQVKQGRPTWVLL